MANSKTVIANLAISHLGINKNISDFDNDRSAEGNAVRQYYEQCLEEVLSDFWWSFARAYGTLDLVKENPTIEWGYAYRYPSTCLTLRRILSGQRTDSRQSRVPFEIGNDAQGGLVYTDMQAAQIEYTFLNKNVSQYPASFVMALSLKIAFMIAPTITAGDPFKLRTTIQDAYDKSLMKAEANVANEDQPDREVESEYIRARGAGAGYDWYNGRRRLFLP